MGWVSGIGLLGAAAAWTPSLLRAHCTQEIAPTVEITYPADGVSVETVCWPVFETCNTDTFHRAELLAELAARYGSSTHAAFLYADSLRNQPLYDSVYYQGQLYYVDTFQVEDLWLSVHSELKGSLQRKRFAFRDRFVHVPGRPFATTYTALLDTPMLAFFDSYDSLSHLGIGPLDGCFFEPTAYVVADGRIRKKASDESARMPGVSVSVEEFFKAAGISAMPIPPVRPRTAGLAARRVGITGAPGAGPPGAGTFDLLGRWLRERPSWRPSPAKRGAPGR